MKINLRRRLFASQDRCQFCGSTNDLQIDHILPKAKGGPDIEGNLQVLCLRCNNKKRDNIQYNRSDKL